jgi:hypothetical protein
MTDSALPLMPCVTTTIPLSDLADIRVGYALRNSIADERHGDIAVIQMKDAKPALLAQPQTLARIGLPRLPTRHLLREEDLIFRACGVTHPAWMIGALAEKIGARILSMAIIPNGNAKKMHYYPAKTHSQSATVRGNNPIAPLSIVCLPFRAGADYAHPTQIIRNAATHHRKDAAPAIGACAIGPTSV